jgi:hypothetical protein
MVLFKYTNSHVNFFFKTFVLVEESERISGDDEDFHAFEISCTDQVVLIFSTVVSKVQPF